jgi:hypothetical protein
MMMMIIIILSPGFDRRVSHIETEIICQNLYGVILVILNSEEFK